jgi:uncharacterized protein YdiU (UPF0061 family)
MFAKHLQPLLSKAQADEIMKSYDTIYTTSYNSLMREKFGFRSELPGDADFFADFFDTMGASHADFTDSFVALTDFVRDTNSGSSGGNSAVSDLTRKLVGRCGPPSSVAAALQVTGYTTTLYHYIILYYTTLYYTILYYTTLYYITPTTSHHHTA